MDNVYIIDKNENINSQLYVNNKATAQKINLIGVFIKIHSIDFKTCVNFIEYKNKTIFIKISYQIGISKKQFKFYKKLYNNIKNS